MTFVEAAVETLDSALAAERAGADRIELCANLSDGGTTPSAGLTAAVAERAQLPVVVLIRRRGTALEGASVIAALVDQARERIAIMAGGGRMRNLIGVVNS